MEADIDLPGLLRRLRLPTMARLLEQFATRAAAEAWTYLDFLTALVTEEIAHRQQTRIEKATRKARFPYLKTIEEFDFTFQSSLRRTALAPFLDPDFAPNGRNLLLSGRSGVGKTHLCIAVAYKAIQHGYTARFVSAADLIDELSAAAIEGRLREATAAYHQGDVLIIDEVGYLHHADSAANVLYGVIDGRYHRKRSVLCTTNKPFHQWGEVLHDQQLAEAILDRLLERGTHIRLGGKSWRTRHIDDEDGPDVPPEASPCS